METLSNRHEREFAEAVPSTLQTLASGGVLEKHDARSEQTEDNRYWRYRSELKCTQKKSYSLKCAEWKELVEYSALQGERPAWAIRFYEEGEARPNLPVKADLVVLDLNDYVELLEELGRLRGGQKD